MVSRHELDRLTALEKQGLTHNPLVKELLEEVDKYQDLAIDFANMLHNMPDPDYTEWVKEGRGVKCPTGWMDSRFKSCQKKARDFLNNLPPPIMCGGLIM